MTSRMASLGWMLMKRYCSVSFVRSQPIPVLETSVSISASWILLKPFGQEALIDLGIDRIFEDDLYGTVRAVSRISCGNYGELFMLLWAYHLPLFFILCPSNARQNQRKLPNHSVLTDTTPSLLGFVNMERYQAYCDYPSQSAAVAPYPKFYHPEHSR
jgi:hypothetical protein